MVGLGAEAENEIADAVELASELRLKADEEENGAVAKLEKELERELGIAQAKKQHGPLRIPLNFDEAMRLAVQVPPPAEEDEERPAKEAHFDKK